MIKIIKYGMEFNIPQNNVVKFDAMYDGIIVTLTDNTEIKFSFAVSPQIKAILPIIKTTPVDIVTINLDYAISGQYDKVLTLTSKPIEPVHEVTINHVITEVKKPTAKKIGRPKKSQK